MTNFSSVGLSIVASSPLWLDAEWAENLTDQVSTYSHTINALGGYWQASFTIKTDQASIEDWIQDGLGRNVDVYNQAGVLVWQGFVNKITATIGPMQPVFGPLLGLTGQGGVRNKVSVVYSTVDHSVEPPVVGVRVTTDVAEDTDSQALYGILPEVRSIAGATETLAEQLRDRYLEENAYPHSTDTWNVPGGQDVSIAVECLGYVHWLLYPFNDDTTGEVNASTKLASILADDPNIAWTAWNTVYIETNTVQVGAWEDENRIAWSLIKAITALGGSSQERWLFGVYDNRDVYYDAAPTETEYIQRLSDNELRVETMEGGNVLPWDVRPGKWVLRADFLAGRAMQGTATREDPRERFIESVRYTAPWILQMQSGTADTVPQLLAQMGLAGVGA